MNLEIENRIISNLILLMSSINPNESNQSEINPDPTSTVAEWAYYKALSNVNIDNKNIQNVGGLSATTGAFSSNVNIGGVATINTSSVTGNSIIGGDVTAIGIINGNCVKTGANAQGSLQCYSGGDPDLYMGVSDIVNDTVGYQLNGNVGTLGDFGLNINAKKPDKSFESLISINSSQHTSGKAVDFIQTPLNNCGKITVANATQSTSTNTGSILTAGGLGVTKDVYIGGITNLESTDNEALRVLGGVSINKSLAVSQNFLFEGDGNIVGNTAMGGNLNITGNLGNVINIASTFSTPALRVTSNEPAIELDRGMGNSSYTIFNASSSQNVGADHLTIFDKTNDRYIADFDGTISRFYGDVKADNRFIGKSDNKELALATGTIIDTINVEDVGPGFSRSYLTQGGGTTNLTINIPNTAINQGNIITLLFKKWTLTSSTFNVIISCNNNIFNRAGSAVNELFGTAFSGGLTLSNRYTVVKIICNLGHAYAYVANETN